MNHAERRQGEARALVQVAALAVGVSVEELLSNSSSSNRHRPSMARAAVEMTLLARGWGVSMVARALGRNPSAVSRLCAAYAHRAAVDEEYAALLLILERR